MAEKAGAEFPAIPFTYLMPAGTEVMPSQAGYLASACAAGAMSDQSPVSIESAAVAGASGETYGSRFFHGVYIVPDAVDVGQLLDEFATTIEVWNAEDAALTLDAVGTSGTEGCSFEAAAATPFAAKQSRVYDLVVEMFGPDTINAVWTLSFDSGAAPRLTVTGSRMLVFAFPPDWSDPVAEAFTWPSDVHEAWDGTEQRISLVENPRRELEYRLTATGAQARLLLSNVHGWQGRRFLVPWWQDCAQLGAALGAGALGVAADTGLRSMVGGSFIVLWRSPSYFEAIPVTSAEDGYVTFERATTKSFLSTDRILPARLCYLSDSQDLGCEADDTFKVAVRLRESAGLGIGYLGGVAPATYAGRDLLVLRPNWGAGYGQSVSRGLVVDDFGVGAFQERPRTSAPRVSTRMELHLADRQSVADFLAFLSARKGRVAPFWCPSRIADLKLAVDMGATETVMTVENCGYSRLVGLSTVRQDVCIRLGGGVHIYRQIGSAQEVDSATERLTLSAAVGVPVNKADVLAISFLEPCRLDQDRVELAWLTDSVATSVITRVAVPEDPSVQHSGGGGVGRIGGVVK